MLQPQIQGYKLKQDWLGHQAGTVLHLYPHFARDMIARGLIIDDNSNQEEEICFIKKLKGRPKGSKNKKTYSNKMYSKYKNKKMEGRNEK